MLPEPSSRWPRSWRCTTSWFPPTINLENLDPEVQLDIVSGQARKLAEDRFPGAVALNNSFGFGGHNVALAFRSYP